MTYQDMGCWKISLLLQYQAVHWHRMMILNYSKTEHEPGEEEEIYNAGEGEEEASHRAREGARGSTVLRTSLHIGRLSFLEVCRPSMCIPLVYWQSSHLVNSYSGKVYTVCCVHCVHDILLCSLSRIHNSHTQEAAREYKVYCNGI